MGRRWTPAEDVRLVASMDRQAVDVARELDRSPFAVEKRRERLFALGVLTERGRHPSQARRTWTADEDAIVRATVDQPIRNVASLIPGHTSDAIRARRRTLRRRDSSQLKATGRSPP